MRFVFDMDDTLAHYFPAMLAMINKVFPDFDVNTITNRDTHNYLGITSEQWREIMVGNQLLETLQPKGDLSLVSRLLEEGHEVSFLTARHFYPNAIEVTQQWLYDHLPYYPEDWTPDVHVVDFQTCKADYISKTWGHIDYLIEDDFETMRNVLDRALATRVIAINMVWNEKHFFEADEKYHLSTVRIPEISHFKIEYLEHPAITCSEQRTEWINGASYHNPVRDECCPDFSCCVVATSKVTESINVADTNDIVDSLYTKVKKFGYCDAAMRVIFSKHNIISRFVMCIVEQAGIPRAISDMQLCMTELNNALNTTHNYLFNEEEYCDTDLDSLKNLCLELVKLPSIQRLNISVSEMEQGIVSVDDVRRSAFTFESRYSDDKRRTRDSFVALEALARNVAMEICYDHQMTQGV